MGKRVALSISRESKMERKREKVREKLLLNKMVSIMKIMRINFGVN